MLDEPTTKVNRVEFIAPRNVGLIREGDDLTTIISTAFQQDDLELRNGDVVIAQKIVSKAEGRYVYLADLTPSPKANELGAICDKDPRLVLRCVRNVIVVENHHGIVLPVSTARMSIRRSGASACCAACSVSVTPSCL